MKRRQVTQSQWERAIIFLMGFGESNFTVEKERKLRIELLELRRIAKARRKNATSHSSLHPGDASRILGEHWEIIDPAPNNMSQGPKRVNERERDILRRILDALSPR